MRGRFGALTGAALSVGRRISGKLQKETIQQIKNIAAPTLLVH